MQLLHGSRYSVRELRVALQQGYKPAGDCTAPVGISLKGYPDEIRVKLGLEKDQPAIANYEVRCRQCAACLLHRSNLWAARASAECALASRTWFGTLTLAPQRRVQHLYAAQKAGSQRLALDWASIVEADRFRLLAASIQPELTKYLKRVRKQSKANLRYLLVSEAHKDGFPHFHALVHEVGDSSVTKRTLGDQWRYGFSQWRLVRSGDVEQAFYVCKYLAKSALTRVRASQSYGQPGPYAGLYAEKLEGALRLFRKTVCEKEVLPRLEQEL